jgi:hypothetical protein
MKSCIACDQTKPLSMFYAHPKMKDGHLNKCKDCCKQAASKRRSEKLEEIKAYDRMRGSLPHRLEANKIRQKTPHGSVAHQEANRRYRERYKNRSAARYIFGNAVRDGKITRLPCQVCGNDKSEGHHPDYDRPLDVVWLCVTHHKAAHKLGNAIERGRD